MKVIFEKQEKYFTYNSEFEYVYLVKRMVIIFAKTFFRNTYFPLNISAVLASGQH